MKRDFPKSNSPETKTSTANDAKERDIRLLLRKYALRFRRVLVSKGFLQNWGGLVTALAATFEMLRRESRRKVPSKAYRAFYEGLGDIATMELGPFVRLTSEELLKVDRLVSGFLKAMSGNQAAFSAMTPADFVGIQKKLFMEVKKRGPKKRTKYDEAFFRRMSGQSLTSIVKDFEPENYNADPEKVLQRYSKAIQRRKRQADRI